MLPLLLLRTQVLQVRLLLSELLLLQQRRVRMHNRLRHLRQLCSRTLHLLLLCAEPLLQYRDLLLQCRDLLLQCHRLPRGVEQATRLLLSGRDVLLCLLSRSTDVVLRSFLCGLHLLSRSLLDIIRPLVRSRCLQLRTRHLFLEFDHPQFRGCRRVLEIDRLEFRNRRPVFEIDHLAFRSFRLQSSSVHSLFHVEFDGIHPPLCISCLEFRRVLLPGIMLGLRHCSCCHPFSRCRLLPRGRRPLVSM